MNKEKFKLFAFTLAETLITLVIIGVVAALTIPALVNKHQEDTIRTALKKNYSVLQDVLNQFYVKNGYRLAQNDVTGTRSLKEKILPYFSILKDCNFNDCVAIDVYKTYNGNAIYHYYFDDGQFILNDGTTVLIENMGGTNIFISVDVNSFEKGPNRLGKDLFMFQVDAKGILLPMGAKGTNYYSATDEYCSKTSTNNMNGAGCTVKMLDLTKS